MAPGCKRPWNLDFLLANFTKKFVNEDLKLHRRKQLYDRELSLLPATQPAVEEEIWRRKKAERVRELRQELKKAQLILIDALNERDRMHWKKQKIQQEIAGISATIALDTSVSKEEMKKLKAKKKEKTIEVKELNFKMRHIVKVPKNTINELKREINRTQLQYDNGLQTEKTERRQFVRACPADGCRGFLSTQWKCGLCEVKVCPDCHEIKSKDGKHECKPENVESAKLIAKDSKPCPNCGAVSIKIQGCDQVWCMSCHVAWSWSTHRVVNGRIHAADYYIFMERMRNAGAAAVPGQRVHGDVPCGGMPDLFHLDRHLRKQGIDIACVFGYDLWNFHRNLMHMYEMDAHRIRPDTNRDNQDLRMRYLMNEIDQKEFQRQLQIREKKQLKNNELYQIMATFYEVASEAFRQLFHQDVNVENIIQELLGLCKYAEEGAQKISKTYNCVLYKIPRLEAKKKGATRT
jgi:hypothetical protein